MLDLQLKPNACAWEMHPDGSYVRFASDDSASNCQQALIDLFENREKEASKTRRRRRKGFARRATK